MLAGGAVRDLLMGLSPGDLDIATSAKPEDVEALFADLQTVAVGKAFGVIRVVLEGHSIEVATYRHDLAYVDGRRPTGVVYTNRVEDAKRRDFTINALFYDPFTEIVYDDIDGKADLENKILKCVGDAEARFREDELRRLRLVRFVSQLGFNIEGKTLAALKKNIQGLQKVSRERITDEIGKMWKGKYLGETFPLWLKSGMAAEIDPAWSSISTAIPQEIWNLPRSESGEVWVHYFSFFFEHKDFKNHLKLLKLSRDTEKFVLQVQEAYVNIEKFLKSSWGEQRLQASQKFFLLSFRHYILRKTSGEESVKLRQILENFKKQPALPEALIKAQHIQDQFQGALLGRWLKKLYIEQLNQEWTTPEQALAWLNKNILNDS